MAKPKKKKAAKKDRRKNVLPFPEDGMVHIGCADCMAYIESHPLLFPLDGDVRDESYLCSFCSGDEIPDLTPGPCERCSLSEGATTIKMYGSGAEKPKVMLIGEAPGQVEDREGEPFVGPAGKKLREYLADSEIPLEWVRFSNVVRCCPLGVRSNPKPSPSEISACRPYVLREIVKHDPEVIVAVGGVSLNGLTGSKQKITTVHGRKMDLTFELDGITHSYTVIPTIHPSAVLRGNVQYEQMILEDLAMVRRRVSGEKTDLGINHGDTLGKVEAAVDTYLERYAKGEIDFVAVDIEATSKGEDGGLEIFHPTWKMLCVTVCGGKAGGGVEAHTDSVPLYIPYQHKLSPFANDALSRQAIDHHLTRLFRTVPVAGQNFQYDQTAFVARTKVWIPMWRGRGLAPGLFHDTMLAGWSLTNDTEPHDLDYMATRWAGMLHPKERMHEAQAELPKGADPYEDVEYEIFVEYACFDAISTARLVPIQRELLEEENLLEPFEMLTMNSHTFALWMRVSGVYVDLERNKEVADAAVEELTEIRDWFRDEGYDAAVEEQYNYKLGLGSWVSLNFLIHGVLGLPYMGNHFTDKTADPKNSLTRRNFRQPDGRVLQGSTEKDVLSRMEVWIRDRGKKSDDPEVKEFCERCAEMLEKLLLWKKVGKNYSSYLKPLPDLTGYDGCAHANWGVRTTGTGRWSANDPPIQTIPFRGGAKSVYKTRFKGGLLVVVDYGQMELRDGCRLSGDANMMEIFLIGLDIHRTSAARILKKALEAVTGDERRGAKAANFGTMYGAGPPGIADMYGITLEEAKLFQEGIFREFPGLRELWDKQSAILKEHGAVWTSLGSRRLLPDIYSKNQYKRSSAERQAMNTPIQGGSSDWATLALQMLFDAVRGEDMWTVIWGFIHDSFEADCPGSEVVDYIELASRCMVDDLVERFKEHLTVPLEIDFEVGTSWGEMVDAELLSDGRRGLRLKCEHDVSSNMKKVLDVMRGWPCDVEFTYLHTEEKLIVECEIPEFEENVEFIDEYRFTPRLHPKTAEAA